MSDRHKPASELDDPQRSGAKQPERFDAHRADKLDDPSRFEYLPPDAILSLLDLPTGALLVDFGAGTGAFAIRLAQARPDVSVVALDEQAAMLERLRAKPQAQTLANLRAVLPDELPRLAGRADRVLALNVLHELGDAALASLAGLLGQNGFALFIDWNSEADRPVGPPRDHVYGPAEAVDRLERLGFTVQLLPSLLYHYVLRAKPRAATRD
jgi:SAM-dependent methyltransferase